MNTFQRASLIIFILGCFALQADNAFFSNNVVQTVTTIAIAIGGANFIFGDEILK